MTQRSSWKEYQEEAAAFFRSLGMSADTDVKLRGVRTEHAVDVLVRSEHAGFEVRWLIECKLWKKRVSKVHVLALREIVSDLGADRGILLAEAGFQSGALEAANITNVFLTDLAALKQSAEDQVFSMRFRDLYDRIERCKTKYWSLDKSVRIACGLRPDVGEYGYSGTSIIEISEKLVSLAFRGSFPIEVDQFDRMGIAGIQERYSGNSDLYESIDILISELENRIEACLALVQIS